MVAIDGTGLTPELRDAIHSGKVAGVVLFEADFPSRAAGPRTDRRRAGGPAPARLRRLPLLVMTDQEGGAGEAGRRAARSLGGDDGAEGPAVRAPPRPGDRREPERASASTSTSPRSSTSAAPAA